MLGDRSKTQSLKKDRDKERVSEKFQLRFCRLVANCSIHRQACEECPFTDASGAPKGKRTSAAYGCRHSKICGLPVLGRSCAALLTNIVGAVISPIYC